MWSVPVGSLIPLDALDTTRSDQSWELAPGTAKPYPTQKNGPDFFKYPSLNRTEQYTECCASCEAWFQSLTPHRVPQIQIGVISDHRPRNTHPQKGQGSMVLETKTKHEANFKIPNKITNLLPP